MQGLSRAPANGRMVPIVCAILGILLLALVTGVWVCLWVPPWPIF
jgi:hypothetical protein